MKADRLLSRLAGSRAVGHSVRLAKVLSFAGTVKGAVATVLVVAGTVGGAATVNTVVREELDRQADRAEAVAHPTPSPPTTPSIRSQAGAKLAATLAEDARSLEALRKISSLGAPQLEALISDSKERLQRRYEAGLALLDSLLAEPTDAGDSRSTAGIALVLDALMQVITDDLGSIVVHATFTATGRQQPVETAPGAVPLTVPAGSVDVLRAEAEARLQAVLAADNASLDDLLRGVNAASAPLDQIVSDAKQRLQSRYDAGLGLLRALVSESAPTSPSTVSAVDALVQVITKDLNAITQDAMLTARPTASPTATSAILLPPLFQLPQPPALSRTATPRPPTPTPPSASARTTATPPRTATPSPPPVRTGTPPPLTPRPSASH